MQTFSGMDPLTHVGGREHVMFENRSWFSAFNAQLSVSCLFNTVCAGVLSPLPSIFSMSATSVREEPQAVMLHRAETVIDLFSRYYHQQQKVMCA
jgi:hypothetical protein